MIDHVKGEVSIFTDGGTAITISTQASDDWLVAVNRNQGNRPTETIPKRAPKTRA